MKQGKGRLAEEDDEEWDLDDPDQVEQLWEAYQAYRLDEAWKAKGKPKGKKKGSSDNEWFDRCRKEGLCLGCGQKGHRVGDVDANGVMKCPKASLATESAGMAWTIRRNDHHPAGFPVDPRH